MLTSVDIPRVDIPSKWLSNYNPDKLIRSCGKPVEGVTCLQSPSKTRRRGSSCSRFIPCSEYIHTGKWLNLLSRGPPPAPYVCVCLWAQMQLYAPLCLMLLTTEWILLFFCLFYFFSFVIIKKMLFGDYWRFWVLVVNHHFPPLKRRLRAFPEELQISIQLLQTIQKY